MTWIGAVSPKQSLKSGVPQGSVLGPTIFILLTVDLPLAVDITGQKMESSTSQTYADDVVCVAVSQYWDNVTALLEQSADRLVGYSIDSSLHLNPNKTQVLLLGKSAPGSFMVEDVRVATSDSLTLLGVKLDAGLRFNLHHQHVLTCVRQRLGVIRRLTSRISRGPLLTEIARSLVNGKLQCVAWITRKARTDPNGWVHVLDADTQVLLNDICRTLVGVRRENHITVSDLSSRANMPTLNELVVRGAALAAWKASRGSVLAHLLTSYDDRSRANRVGLLRPCTVNNIVAVNMAACLEAKRAAHKLASECRMF